MSNSSNHTTLMIVGGLVLAGLFWARGDNGSLETKAISFVDERTVYRSDSIRELPIEWDKATSQHTEDLANRLAPQKPPTPLPQGWHGNPFAEQPEKSESSADEALLRILAEHKISRQPNAVIREEPDSYEARYGGRARPTARRYPDQDHHANDFGQQRVNQTMSEMPATHVIPPPTDRLLAKLQRGETLARRGATATAQKEFTEILTLIAQHNDAVRGETSSSIALNRALRAISEAEDFVAPENQATLSVSEQVLRHQTRVLNSQEAQGMTALAAAQVYYSYARKMFREAFQHDPIASRTLFRLAKLHAFELATPTPSVAIHAQVMLLHYAALDCDPQNFPAANELGVMLAKGGRLAEARDYLAHSVNVQATVSSLQNLAFVQHQMGDGHGAQQTAAHAQSMAEAQSRGTESEPIVMVDQRSFNEIPDRSTDFYVRQEIPQGTANPKTDSATKNKRWFMWR